MSSTRSFSDWTKIVPAAAAFILILVVVSVLLSHGPIEANADELYDVQSLTAVKETSPFSGVLDNGEAVQDMDIINVTALNADPPNSSEHVLVLSVLVNDSTGSQRESIKWSLSYVGSGSEFRGNITINSTLESSYAVSGENLTIKGHDGDNISIKKYNSPNLPLLHFTVDLQGPGISPMETISFVAQYEGKCYIKTGSEMNFTFTDSDPETTYQWLIDNEKITYGWTGTSQSIYNGSAIDVPSGSNVTIWVNATDRYGHYTNWSKTYHPTTFLNSETSINTTMPTYSSQILFIGKQKVANGGSLSFSNCELVFLESGDTLSLKEGSSLNIRGSNITSLDGLFTLSSEDLSSMSIADSIIHCPSDVASTSSVLEMESGTLDNVTISDLNNRIWMKGGGVEMKDSHISTGSAGSVYIDTQHQWDSSKIKVHDTVINGSSFNPVIVHNTSIWRPRDIEEYYYNDVNNVTTTFTLNTTNMTAPYIWLPHYIDSRSSMDSFDIQYNQSGTWTSFTDYPRSNVIYDEWLNWEDARFDLSHLPEGTVEVRIDWTTTSDDESCIYLGSPKMGAAGIDEIGVGSGPFQGDLIGWTANKVSGPYVQMHNISIENALYSFIHTESSGLVELSQLHLGGTAADHDPSRLLTSDNATVELKDTGLVCNSNTLMAYEQLFGAGNDWGMSSITNSSVSSTTDNTSSYGIMVQGGWLHLLDVTLEGNDVGVYSYEGMVSLRTVEISSEKKGYRAKLPDDLPWDPKLKLDDVKMIHKWEDTAIWIHGRPTNYDMDLMMNYTLDSNYFTEDIQRSDGLGAVVLDLKGNTSPEADLKGSIRDSPRHGIAVPHWPASGAIRLDADSQIRNIRLDGIYLGDGIHLKADTNQIMNCRGYAVYAGDETFLSMEKDQSLGMVHEMNRMGGIRTGNNSLVDIARLSIKDTGGWSVEVGKYSTLNITDSKITRCDGGVKINAGSTVILRGISINYTSEERGIYSKDSTISIIKGSSRSDISNNKKDAVFIDGGKLHINMTKIDDNIGTGLKLLNVDVDEIWDCRIRRNSGDGIYFHIQNDSVLTPNGNYVTIRTVDIENNGGVGISATVNPMDVSGTVEVTLKSIVVGNNNGGDIIAPKNVHFDWTADQNSVRDILGSDLFSGRVRANIDLTIGDSCSASIKNMNITLLGDGKWMEVGEIGFLKLENCYISPAHPSYRFSIIGHEGASIDIEGGFLGQLYRLEAKKSSSFKMDGTLVKNSNGPIYLEDTPFNIMDCEFSGIGGTAMTISGGAGSIKDSKFSGNTIGVKVDDLDGDLLISGSEFKDNNWGLYLFSSSGHNINLTNCHLSDNSPAPIWVGSADVRLLDTSIDPDKIMVTQEDRFVMISYTLEVFLYDEKGDWVTFDLFLDMGPGKTYKSFIQEAGRFRGELEVYKVVKDEVQNKGVTIDLKIEYVEGREYGEDKIGTIEDTFDLDTRTTITYNGYMAPTVTQKFPGNLEALEDKGFKNGPVDVSPWFNDIGNDPGNLTFSSASFKPQIEPSIQGSMLSLTLKENWNGKGNITVTATDPHGKSLTLVVTINVLPENDLPIISNPRIIVKDSNTPNSPKTGDTIKAVWEWYDVDGDPEPRTSIIRWFLNGKHQPDLDNNVQVTDVFSGQIWNFTIYPRDQKDIDYDNPVNSPPVMIGNRAPTLSSVSIKTVSPNTNTDLIAEPRGGNDTETDAVIYNYLWEKRVSSNWVPLGAPNSPILDNRFTSKHDDIRVSCWVSDGISISEIRTDTVNIKNSAPYVKSARINPEVVDEHTEMVYLTNIEWGDPDGDIVTLNYAWMVNGVQLEISDTLPQLMKSQAGWEYPSNITVGITPFDSDYKKGNTYYQTVYIQPTDTDGDGLFDDANGNGMNDPGDDKDDDNDGFPDEWEIYLGTDPKDPLSKPRDTDGDGIPDGDSENSQDWMDLDDDNDGVWDIHPDNPEYFDTYPLIPGLPGDMDYDGIGDDQDPDIDGDGVPNKEDAYPRDAERWKEPEQEDYLFFEISTFILLLLIIITIGVLGYLIYNGTIKLPTHAPPPVEADAEAIYDTEEEEAKKERLPPKEEGADIVTLEEVDNMRVCSSCGEIVTLGDEICPNCGATFELEEDEEEELSFDDEDEDFEEFEDED